MSLPVVTISLNEVFSSSKYTGTSFLFGWNEVLNNVSKANTSLDRFLSIRLGSYIQSRKYKVPILILFTPAGEAFKITVCSKSAIDFTPCLHRSSGMPGYIDYGEEPIERNARPFIYYSGERIYRTYHFIDQPEEGKFFSSDFGNQFGLTVTSCENSFYQELVDGPSEKPEYSFVPIIEIEEIVTPQNYLIIHHIIAQLKN